MLDLHGTDPATALRNTSTSYDPPSVGGTAASKASSSAGPSGSHDPDPLLEATIEVPATESKEKDNEIEEEKKLSPVQKRERTRKQAGSYAREMFAHGVPRTHVIGITIDDTLARMHYYDHSKVIESPVSNSFLRTSRSIRRKSGKSERKSRALRTARLFPSSSPSFPTSWLFTYRIAIL